jgi:hypothetical protein
MNTLFHSGYLGGTAVNLESTVRVEVDSRTIVRVGAGAARRELYATDVSGERNVGVVEFTCGALLIAVGLGWERSCLSTMFTAG